jgi:hypothetical protein
MQARYSLAPAAHSFMMLLDRRDLRMPGVQFPFSTATEDERLAAISNQIGTCARRHVFSCCSFWMLA